jgi:hypothetical protein
MTKKKKRTGNYQNCGRNKLPEEERMQPVTIRMKQKKINKAGGIEELKKELMEFVDELIWQKENILNNADN